MRGPAIVAIVGLAASLSGASAQSIDGARAGVVSPAVVSPAGDSVQYHPTGVPASRVPATRNRNVAPLASLVVPGSGQYLLSNDRFVGYLAVEALAWWMYAKDIHERRDREAQFKELARDVARAHYSTTLPDGPWSYYEWMRDFQESGAYSKNATGPVVPETDTTTYNGKKWDLFQGIYPTEAEALAQYEKVAIKPEYRWSWRDHRFERDIYMRYTDKRNDANRAAVRDLLLVGANHLLSMFDAFTTARLQVQPGPDGQTRFGASLRW
jgi:hypothetical protein